VLRTADFVITHLPPDFRDVLGQPRARPRRRHRDPPDEPSLKATSSVSTSPIPLTLKDLLHKPGEAIRHVYFSGGGFCSMLTVLEDGTMVEVATIGREGVIGMSAVLDNGPTTAVTMVQGASDTCYRMAASDFRPEMQRRGPFSTC
jgi:CRP-like cAMP-binding protein